MSGPTVLLPDHVPGMTDLSARLPLGRQVMQYADKLTRWRTRLSNARFEQAVIVCIGDSITEGAYANEVQAVDATAVALWRQRGWVAQLRTRFADRFGNPGEGFLMPPIAGVYGAFTNGAAQVEAATTVGGFGRYITLPSGGTATFTCVLPACTGFRVHAWWVDGQSGAIRYKVDAGSQQTAPASSGTDTLYSFEVTGLSDATHTLVFTAPAAGSATILGVEARYTATAGVAIHRVAKSGMVLKDFATLFDAVSTDGNRMVDSATKIFSPNLVVIAMSANNVTRFGLTPAQLQDGFGRVVDRIVANGSDVLLVGGPWRDPTTYSATYSQSEYDEAIFAVAAERDHVATLDLKTAWESYAAGNALGLYWDNIHPRLRGHADIAGMIFDAIGGR